MTLTSCNEVEWFDLKANCSCRIFLPTASSRNFRTTRSSSFDTEDNKVIGLWFTGKLWSLPAFGMVMIIPVFHAEGK
jgi:hypothetical protein